MHPTITTQIKQMLIGEIIRVSKRFNSSQIGKYLNMKKFLYIMVMIVIGVMGELT